jgi:hypothetical protein
VAFDSDNPTFFKLVQFFCLLYVRAGKINKVPVLMRWRSLPALRSLTLSSIIADLYCSNCVFFITHNFILFIFVGLKYLLATDIGLAASLRLSLCNVKSLFCCCQENSSSSPSEFKFVVDVSVTMAFFPGMGCCPFTNPHFFLGLVPASDVGLNLYL